MDSGALDDGSVYVLVCYGLGGVWGVITFVF
jgi:hypothetical protein